MATLLTITNSKETVRIPSDCIFYVEAAGDYSYVYAANGKKTLLTIQLGQLEDLMAKQLGPDGQHLVRLGKSLIINLNYVATVNPGAQELLLSDYRQVEYKLKASREALSALKNLIDAGAKNL